MCRFDIDSIDFHGRHRMLVEEPCVTRVVAWAYDMDEVGLVRLHADCDVLSRIHKRTARWYRGPIGGFPAA